jgi:hypothetical protein
MELSRFAKLKEMEKRQLILESNFFHIYRATVSLHKTQLSFTNFTMK